MSTAIACCPFQRSTIVLALPWATSDEGGLAAFFEQDMSNPPLVRAGLKSRGKPMVTDGVQREGRMRRWHPMIDNYIEDGLRRDGRSTGVLDPHRVVGSVAASGG